MIPGILEGGKGCDFFFFSLHKSTDDSNAMINSALESNQVL